MSNSKSVPHIIVEKTGGDGKETRLHQADDLSLLNYLEEWMKDLDPDTTIGDETLTFRVAMMSKSKFDRLLAMESTT